MKNSDILCREMRIEQLPGSVKRLQYIAGTDSFEETEHLYLYTQLGFTGYYGWISESGTPPSAHLDILLLSDDLHELGDSVDVNIIGCFFRTDGDHKFVAVDTSSDFCTLSQLPSHETSMLHAVFRSTGQGNRWLESAEAANLYCQLMSDSNPKTQREE